MPLREKHVRRTVAVLLMVAVLAPLIGLGAYAISLRGDAYGRAVEEELQLRLRCDAHVRGARPSGPATARADSVDLVWQTGTGRITVHLAEVRATRVQAADLWDIRADQGRMDVQSEDLRETLAAWNQRLVGTQAGQPRVSITTATPFRLSLKSDLLTTALEGEFEAAVRPDGEFEVKFARSGGAPESRAAGLAVNLLADPRSGAGVFQTVEARLEEVPARQLAGWLLGAARGGKVEGTAKVRAAWAREGLRAAQKRDINIRMTGLNLEQWTEPLPGGPVHATARLDLLYTQDDRGRGTLAVDLAADGGDISPETLRWLAGLPAAMKATGLAYADTRMAFAELTVRCRVTGGQGRFEGPADGEAALPLVVWRLFGVDVPLLVADRRSFDAAAVWAPLKKALRGE